MRMRTLTVPAIVAACVLAVAGCSAADEEPTATPSPSATASQDPVASSPPASPSAQPEASDAPPVVPVSSADALVGTSWFGTAEGIAEMTFTLAGDGTVDFSSFNGDPFDTATDVWSVDAGVLSLTISQLQAPSGAVADVVFTGPAATGGMELVGVDGAGVSHPMTIAQV